MRDIKPLPFKTLEIYLAIHYFDIKTDTLNTEYYKYIMDILHAYKTRKKLTNFSNNIDYIRVEGSKTQLYNMIIELSIYFNILIV